MFGIRSENIWQLSPICIYVLIADVQFIEIQYANRVLSQCRMVHILFENTGDSQLI